MKNNQVTTHQHYSPRAILVAIGSSRRMFLLAPLIEFLFADLADVVFVAELFDNIATRFVVIAFAETKVWFFLSRLRAFDHDRLDRRVEQFVVVDVGIDYVFR
jgi:hypothetical protein